MNLNETKKSKETLLANKLQELQGLESTRNNLSADILELRGQIKLIDEMLMEEKTQTSEDTSPK